MLYILPITRPLFYRLHAKIINVIQNTVTALNTLDTPVILIHGPRQCGKTTLALIVGGEKYSYITFGNDTILSGNTQSAFLATICMPFQYKRYGLLPTDNDPERH